MALMNERDDATESLPLSKAAEYLLDECRMVLPGIQALFGFQLIAVFNQGFAEKLSTAEQRLHLLAIGLVVVAVAIIMTPAALHRASPREVTARFIGVSTRLLLSSMLPLAGAVSIDFYLVARVIAGSAMAVPAGALFALFLALWFVLPRARALQAIVSGGRGR
jgi:hypothetical protein